MNFNTLLFLEQPIPDCRDLLARVYRKEKELQSDYYQMITALDPKFIAYQVILKALYQMKYKKPFEDYEFLRSYNDPSLKKELWDLFSEYTDLINIEYIQSVVRDPQHPDHSKFVSYEETDDHEKDIRRHLISASLTLESAKPGESALFYFIRGKSVMKVRRSFLLKQLISAFVREGIPARKADRLIKKLVSEAPTSCYGLVMQIFIPKKDIFSSVYASRPFGYVDMENTQDLPGYFREFESLRESNSFYCYFDYTQVRILARTLHPDRVKIFRYTMIPEEDIQAYEQKVQSTLKNLFK